ncbi:uncharacterized protein LOC118183106, partial [Stegodyphus dumicola]|uniref:uncharacterized protein LOC118183106 n=1 Tax=Stegodyphus dumicola TaxID=202533 RepID=UPI0015AF962E
MGNLPKQRVILERPFFSTGIDYAGPVILKCYKGSCFKTTKGYIALFVCLATKAYHIEVVSDLTADSFIAALRRFVSRRGTPRYLFSDNGTNFVGAKRKLSELQTLLLSLNSNELILNYLAENTVEWKMIPPASPHFGGLWELTFEELTTLLTQIEAVLNSRPLSKTNHNDVGNLDALTPSHFLTGDVLTSIPEQDFSNIPKPTLLKRWELLQQMKQGFWK